MNKIIGVYVGTCNIAHQTINLIYDLEFQSYDFLRAFAFRRKYISFTFALLNTPIMVSRKFLIWNNIYVMIVKLLFSFYDLFSLPSLYSKIMYTTTWKEISGSNLTKPRPNLSNLLNEHLFLLKYILYKRMFLISLEICHVLLFYLVELHATPPPLLGWDPPPPPPRSPAMRCVLICDIWSYTDPLFFLFWKTKTKNVCCLRHYNLTVIISLLWKSHTKLWIHWQSSL